jgi:succinylglutamic semialdehyde dehydrogenase
MPVFVGTEGTALIDSAVEQGRRAQRAWKRRPLEERIAVIDRFNERLGENSPKIALQIMRETGKLAVDAAAEMKGVLARWEHTKQIAVAELQRQQPAADACYDLVPLGVVAVISPFNFPIHLAHGQLLAALVAGNACILKPSDWTAGCAERYFFAWQEAAEESGADPSLLQLIQGGGQTGAALAAHPGVDSVSFTGSYPVGVSIVRAAAAQPSKLIALELGGKNTAIVLDDADLALATEAILTAATATTGQRCTCVSRLVATRGVAEALLDELSMRLEWMESDDPQLESSVMGPLATPGGYERFLAAQEETAGLQTLLKGAAVERSKQGYFVRPGLHLVRDIEAAKGRIERELFGPDLLVEVVDTEEEAVERANATPYGLAMALFTRTQSRFERLRLELEAGVVNWNRPTVGSNALLPFGGIKQSGNHRATGSHALRHAVRPLASMLGG